MVKRILKYPFGGAVEVAIQYPPCSRVLHVGVQRQSDTVPTLWIEHDEAEIAPDAPGDMIRFFLVGTGMPYNGDGVEYVGSAVCADGDFVWHVFRQLTLVRESTC